MNKRKYYYNYITSARNMQSQYVFCVRRFVITFFALYNYLK